MGLELYVCIAVVGELVLFGPVLSLTGSKGKLRNSFFPPIFGVVRQQDDGHVD